MVEGPYMRGRKKHVTTLKILSTQKPEGVHRVWIMEDMFVWHTGKDIF